MFGPGRHFPPAELREWERGERLDPEYQLSAKPPLPCPAQAAPPQKSERIFTKRGVGGGGGRRRIGGGGSGEAERQGGRERENPEVQMGLGLAGITAQGLHLGSSERKIHVGCGDPCWVWRPRVGHINGTPQNLPLLG